MKSDTAPYTVILPTTNGQILLKFADIALIQIDGRRVVIERTSLPPVEFELADGFAKDDVRFYELASCWSRYLASHRGPEAPSQPTSTMTAAADAYFRDALHRLSGTEPPEHFKFRPTDEALAREQHEWCAITIRPSWACGISLLEAAEKFVEDAWKNGNIDHNPPHASPASSQSRISKTTRRKKWTSPSGLVYRRLAKGIVFEATDFCTHFYRVEQNGRLKTSPNLASWLLGGPLEAREAIAALWPTPTKDQLWQRVARLAGEVLLIDGPNIGAFSFGSDYESGADSVRALIRNAGQWHGSHHAKLEALKKTFAAWEKAE